MHSTLYILSRSTLHFSIVLLIISTNITTNFYLITILKREISSCCGHVCQMSVQRQLSSITKFMHPIPRDVQCTYICIGQINLTIDHICHTSILTHIFKFSLFSQVNSRRLEVAQVIPLSKSPNPIVPSQFRPI